MSDHFRALSIKGLEIMTASSLHKVLTKTKLKKDFKNGGTINESYHITFSRDGDFFLT